MEHREEKDRLAMLQTDLLETDRKLTAAVDNVDWSNAVTSSFSKIDLDGYSGYRGGGRSGVRSCTGSAASSRHSSSTFSGRNGSLGSTDDFSSDCGQSDPGSFPGTPSFQATSVPSFRSESSLPLPPLPPSLPRAAASAAPAEADGTTDVSDAAEPEDECDSNESSDTIGREVIRRYNSIGPHSGIGGGFYGGISGGRHATARTGAGALGGIINGTGSYYYGPGTGRRNSSRPMAIHNQMGEAFTNGDAGYAAGDSAAPHRRALSVDFHPPPVFMHSPRTPPFGADGGDSSPLLSPLFSPHPSPRTSPAHSPARPPCRTWADNSPRESSADLQEWEASARLPSEQGAGGASIEDASLQTGERAGVDAVAATAGAAGPEREASEGVGVISLSHNPLQAGLSHNPLQAGECVECKGGDVESAQASEGEGSQMAQGEHAPSQEAQVLSDQQQLLFLQQQQQQQLQHRRRPQLPQQQHLRLGFARSGSTGAVGQHRRHRSYVDHSGLDPARRFGSSGSIGSSCLGSSSSCSGSGGCGGGGATSSSGNGGGGSSSSSSNSTAAGSSLRSRSFGGNHRSSASFGYSFGSSHGLSHSHSCGVALNLPHLPPRSPLKSPGFLAGALSVPVGLECGAGEFSPVTRSPRPPKSPFSSDAGPSVFSGERAVASAAAAGAAATGVAAAVAGAATVAAESTQKSGDAVAAAAAAAAGAAALVANAPAPAAVQPKAESPVVTTAAASTPAAVTTAAAATPAAVAATEGAASAPLQGASLQEASLQGPSLQGAPFQGAPLQGAPLQGALTLHEDQIKLVQKLQQQLQQHRAQWQQQGQQQGQGQQEGGRGDQASLQQQLKEALLQRLGEINSATCFSSTAASGGSGLAGGGTLHRRHLSASVGISSPIGSSSSSSSQQIVYPAVCTVPAASPSASSNPFTVVTTDVSSGESTRAAGDTRNVSLHSGTSLHSAPCAAPAAAAAAVPAPSAAASAPAPFAAGVSGPVPTAAAAPFAPVPSMHRCASLDAHSQQFLKSLSLYISRGLTGEMGHGVGGEGVGSEGGRGGSVRGVGMDGDGAGFAAAGSGGGAAAGDTGSGCFGRQSGAAEVDPANLSWRDYILRMPYENVKRFYSVSAVRIGSGRYGVIRPCTHRGTGVKMAIKTIKKEQIKCKEDAEDVRTEVIILGLLRNHPCIINLHDAFEDEKYVHLVMELCEGGDLFDRVKQRGQFTEHDAALVCRGLAEALLHCSSRGVLHRDVKPENVLLCSKDCDSRIKLIDFGVAAMHTPGTLRTDRAGTVEYTAPEVLDRAYGSEADVWSAGVVLYILLCGFPPFWAATDSDLEAKIRRAAVDFRHPRWAAISDGAKDLILRMLEKDPTKRISALEIFAHPWIRAAEQQLTPAAAKLLPALAERSPDQVPSVAKPPAEHRDAPTHEGASGGEVQVLSSALTPELMHSSGQTPEVMQPPGQTPEQKHLGQLPPD